MSLKDYIKWNNRAALTYAVGIWTMLGSYAYYRYKGYDVIKSKDDVEAKAENPNREVYKSGSLEYVVVYKENFVPYTTRIYNFFTSAYKDQVKVAGSSGTGTDTNE